MLAGQGGGDGPAFAGRCGAIGRVKVEVVFVESLVVCVAEQREVGDAGRAVVDPVVDVVPVAVDGCAVAAGPYAALVACDERSADRWGNGASGAADVEHFAGAAHHYWDDACVACEPAKVGRAERGAGLSDRRSVGHCQQAARRLRCRVRAARVMPADAASTGIPPVSTVPVVVVLVGAARAVG